MSDFRRSRSFLVCPSQPVDVQTDGAETVKHDDNGSENEQARPKGVSGDEAGKANPAVTECAAPGIEDYGPGMAGQDAVDENPSTPPFCKTYQLKEIFASLIDFC